MKMFRVLTTVSVMALMLTSCEVKFDWPWLKDTAGSGEATTSREVTVGTFDTVTFSATGKVIFDASLPEGVVQLAEDDGKANLLTAELTGTDLVLAAQSGEMADNAEYRLNPGATLKRIVLKGLGELSSAQPLKTPQLVLRLEGMGKMELAVEAEQLTLEQTGAGQIKVTGTATDLTVDSSGLGQVDAEDLVSQTAKVRSSGVGEVRVNAAKVLSVKASGLGAVHYAGKPAETHFDSSGATEIKPLD